MSKPDYVTQSDINMIDHFLLDRGDITRWVHWEERKPIIQKELPELLFAIEALDMAEKILRRLAESIVKDVYKYPDD